MGRLTDVFHDKTSQTQSEGWTSLWNSNEESLWDRGQPSPALVDFLEQHYPSLNSLQSASSSSNPPRRPRALVPACGRGYDVFTLAFHGFDAYSLEVSSTAVKAAQTYSGTQLSSPDPRHFGSSSAQSYDRGQVQFLLGDFFDSDWHDGRKFDLIYDYTFLCALLPELRCDWAKRINELLTPAGVLVCLEFPLYKDVNTPGPPFGMKGVYWNLLAEGGNGIVGRSENIEGSGVRMKRVLYYQPESTFEVGKGTDMISVWGKNSAEARF